MKLKSLYTLATVILLTAATALAAGSTRTGAAKATKAPQRIAAAADIPTQWVDMGEGEFTEDILTDQGQGYEPPTYKVTVQKSVDIPGWYKIVNPFTNNPNISDWPNSVKLRTDGNEYEILIDATNPDAVVIPESEIGVNISYKSASLLSMTEYPYPDDFDLEEEEAEAMVGTLKENVITFSVEESLVLQTQSSAEQTNLSGAFKLVLPEEQGGEDPIIPDDPDDKLTVTIKINDPEFIKGVDVANDPIDLDFNDGVLSFKAEEGDEIYIDADQKNFKINSILINEAPSSVEDLWIQELEENTTIDIDVERYSDNLTATLNIDAPGNIVVTRGTETEPLVAGDNTITFSNRDEKSGKLTISAQPGCEITNITQNGESVNGVDGVYTVTLKADDKVVIETEKLVVKDPVVTIKINDPEFIEYISIANSPDDIEADDFVNGELTLENVKGKTLYFQCYTEDYKVTTFTVNGERKSFNADGTFELTVDGDITIELVVVAYKTFNATIKIDDPANAVVKQNGTTLTLKAGENPITFTDKDPASAKLTIAKTVGDLNITLNGDEDDVKYDFVNEYYTVTLKNEGDVVEISREAVPTANVTLKVTDPDFISDIFADATQITLDFNADGEMSFEAEIGAKLTLTGDTDKFKLNSVSVNGELVNKAGPMFSFNVNEDMVIEFDVVAYQDAEATINVDNAAAVKVTKGASSGTAIPLEDGDNVFTFSNKDPNNGKITIAPQTGYNIEKVTQNEDIVEAQTDGTYSVILAEGDVLKIESSVIIVANYSVTIKATDAAYVKSITADEETVTPAFEDDTMTFEVADGTALTIKGDNDNFELTSVSVDGQKTEDKGPEFKFTVTADITIEFEVEAYRDVTATINVDTPENVKVTAANADEPLTLTPGDNEFTFNNKDAKNGQITITAKEGFRITSVTLNDETVAAKAGAYVVVLAENDVVKITSEQLPAEDPTIRVTVKLDNPGAVIYSYTNAESEELKALVNAKENVFEAEFVKYPTFYATNGYVITSCVDEAGKSADIMYDGGTAFASYSQIKKSKTYTLTTKSDAEIRDAAVSISLYDAAKVSVKRGEYEVYGLKEGDNTVRFKSGSKENEITISSTNPDEKIGDVLLNGESQRASGVAYTLTVKDGDVVKVLAEGAPVVPPVDNPVVTIKSNDPEFIMFVDVDTEEQDLDFTDGEMSFEVEKGSALTIHGDADNYKLLSVTVNGEKNTDVKSSSFRYTVNADLNIEFEVDRYRTLTATIDVDDPDNIKVAKGGSFSSSEVTLKAGEQKFEFTNKDENSGKLTITAQTECRILSITLNGENVQAAEFGVYKVALAENDILKITSKKIIRDKDVIVYRDDASLTNDFTFRYSDGTHRFGFDNGYTTVKFCDEDLPIHCSFQSETIASGTAEVYVDDELVDREDAETDIFSLNPDHNSVVKIFHNGPATFHNLTFAVDDMAGDVTATRDLVKPIDDLATVHSLHAGTKVEFSIENPEAVKEITINDKPVAKADDNNYSFVLNEPTTVKITANKPSSAIYDIESSGDATDVIYNLQGIRVFKGINDLSEGIYIINGKKVRITK